MPGEVLVAAAGMIFGPFQSAPDTLMPGDYIVRVAGVEEEVSIHAQHLDAGRH